MSCVTTNEMATSFCLALVQIHLTFLVGEGFIRFIAIKSTFLQPAGIELSHHGLTTSNYKRHPSRRLPHRTGIADRLRRFRFYATGTVSREREI